MTTLIIDNGGGSIKAGLASSNKVVNIPNACAKVDKSIQYLVSEQILDYRSGSLLHFTRPFDRGYLNNWQCEIDIWTYMFGTHFQGLNPNETSLVLTEPPLNPATLQNDTNEVVFEYFGFQEYLRRPAAFFSMHEFCANPDWNISGNDSCVIVDSGFSFTHTVPFVNRTCQTPAVSVFHIIQFQ
jgi:actin-related protein 6